MQYYFLIIFRNKGSVLTYAGFDVDLLPAEVVTEILHPKAATKMENNGQELRFLDPESLIRPVGRFNYEIKLKLQKILQRRLTLQFFIYDFLCILFTFHLKVPSGQIGFA